MRSTAMMVMPSIFCFGAFPFGIRAIEKPSLAASRRRSWPRGAGRISPARPTSPNTTSPRGSGLLRIDELIASSTARSAAGSAILTPPTALMNTSWSKAAMPAWRCSTASSIARRFCSRPTDSRRAFGRWLASTSAWISTSSGRVPSCVTITQEPGTWLSCCDRNSADGFDTPFRPFSVIANTPSSLTAPKRFLMARTRRKLRLRCRPRSRARCRRCARARAGRPARPLSSRGRPG